MRSFVLAILILLGLGLLAPAARAEATMSCPAGTIDMLDWMTLDSSLRVSTHMAGSSNPLFTMVTSGKFYWTKGSNGYPSDVNLYDSKYIYLWLTEYAWTDPNTYKKFTYNTNVPLAPRCAKPGYPGSTIKVSNTSYMIYTKCNQYTLHKLGTALNEVWGPYWVTLGGNLPSSLKTYVISYRYNCNGSYGNCGDKEEFYVAQKYGLVQWAHYTLNSGRYVQQQKTVFNKLTTGATQPYFPCF